MKLWVDDLRPPPDDEWQWVTTSTEAIRFLNDTCVSVLSLDHDLGEDDTTRPIVLHMCMEDIWPHHIFVHSMNSVGAEWLIQMCERYAPVSTCVRRGLLRG